MTTQIEHTWRDHAACLDADPEVFFPVAVVGPLHDSAIRSARGICSGCGVSKDCLDFAMREGIDEGIWAGTTPEERRRIPAPRRSLLVERYHEEMALSQR
jgi:WhiB family transcriptional regulator, redox-sensing transcriptional regulator